MCQQGWKMSASLGMAMSALLLSVVGANNGSAQNTAPAATKAAVKEAPATKAAPAEKEAAPAKKAAKKKAAGRLPVFYADIVTEEQRTKIYGIQSGYADKIEALAAQIKAIQAQQNAEIEALLTEGQLAKLKEAKEAAAAKRKEKTAATATSVTPKKATAE